MTRIKGKYTSVILNKLRNFHVLYLLQHDSLNKHIIMQGSIKVPFGIIILKSST